MRRFRDPVSSSGHEETMKTADVRESFSALDYDSLFAFVASDADLGDRISVVMRNSEVLKTRKEVECILLHLDFLNALMDEAEIRDDLTSFLCYCVAISPNVRDYVLDELLSEDGIWDVTIGNLVACVVTLLAACCEQSLTSGQMKRIVDYAFLLPDEFLLEKLRLLKPACRSLENLPMKHALRIDQLLNSIVSTSVESGHPADMSLGMLVCSVAKKVNGRSSGERSCFEFKLWKEFLSGCRLDFELPKICNTPVLIHSVEDLPYKAKEEIYQGKGSR